MAGGVAFASGTTACEHHPSEGRAQEEAPANASGARASVSGAPAGSASDVPAAVAPGAAPPVAPAAPPSRPGSGASVEELRAWLEAHPEEPARAALRLQHDRALLPCPGTPEGARCALGVAPVLDGVAQRAARYLERCMECRGKTAVEALRVRVAARERELLREELGRRLGALGRRGARAEAAQVIDAAAQELGQAWATRARRKLRLGPPSGPACVWPESVGFFVSPRAPRVGRPLRVWLTAASALEDAQPFIAGEPLPELAHASAGAAPAWRVFQHRPAVAGELRLELHRAGRRVGCQRVDIHEGAPRPDALEGELVWRDERAWSVHTEELYSAFVEHLFDAPEGTTWHGLDAVTRDERRNLLHDHLGLGEDGPGGPRLLPDCADQPYFLRAYFAWKLGLPFAYRRCRRVDARGRPECGLLASHRAPQGEPVEPPGSASAAPEAPGEGVAAAPSEAPGEGADTAGPRVERSASARFEDYLSQLKDEIHARSLRTPLGAEQSDLYPVELTRAALRPGVVFSDPYGHTLTLVRWVPQGEQPGRLYAVDAQPDGTVGIRRYWRGNFLFSRTGSVGGFGFKAFRPLLRDGERLRPLSNLELAQAPGLPSFSLAQATLPATVFYATMERLLNPRPLPPEQAQQELVSALHRQLQRRVREVQLAQEWLVEARGEVIAMPSGRGIFHASGPWEAYSTPCRDMRLLVGMDALLDFAKEAALGLPAAEAMALERSLREQLEAQARALSISYRRSDGGAQPLSLSELLARREAFEMAYNPNDCPELRWGAREGSEEARACARRAPPAQRREMEALRRWFQRRYSCG